MFLGKPKLPARDRELAEASDAASSLPGERALLAGLAAGRGHVRLCLLLTFAGGVPASNTASRQPGLVCNTALCQPGGVPASDTAPCSNTALCHPGSVLASNTAPCHLGAEPQVWRQAKLQNEEACCLHTPSIVHMVSELVCSHGLPQSALM